MLDMAEVSCAVYVVRAAAVGVERPGDHQCGCLLAGPAEGFERIGMPWFLNRVITERLAVPYGSPSKAHLRALMPPKPLAGLYR